MNLQKRINEAQNNHNKHYKMAYNNTAKYSYHMNLAGKAAEKIARIQNKINALG